MHCRLCKNPELEHLCKVSTDDLKRLHAATLGIDHSYQGRHIEAMRCKDCKLIGFYGEPAAGERYYAKLQTNPWYYETSKPEFGTVAQRISAGSQVLEVGAGAGFFANSIPAARYTGLEFSRTAVAQAGQAGRNVLPEDLAVHAGRHAQAYDWVVAFQVLEHVDDVHLFVANCLAALKPGGFLAFSVPNDEAFVAAEQNNVLNYPPHHLTRWNSTALRSLARTFRIGQPELVLESLSEPHRLNYAKVLVESSLKRVSDEGRMIPQPKWSQFPRRHLVSALARLLLPGLRLRALQPPGHSITAIYQMPFG